MSANKRFKRFQRAAARYGLYATAWAFERLPYGFVKAVTSVLLWVGFKCTVRQRRIAEESIAIAFGGEKTPDERRAIIRRCFRNFGRGMTEMLYYLAHPDAVKDVVSVVGKEHLDAAVARGKGVIAVTAHFGNFALMMLALARMGYKSSAIIRPARDEELSEYLYRKRTEVGLGTVFAIPRRASVAGSLKVLREGKVLFVPVDQNFGRGGGVYVDFFGQKAATATGPAVFAMRTGAPILPMFILRDEQDPDRHRIVIEPPIVIGKRGGEKETVEATMAKITALIERYIRRYPQEWAWMHRRWKSRPKALDT